MKILILLFLFLTTYSSLAEPPKGYQLKWSDEFNGSSLDSTKWKYTFNGLHKKAFYVPEALYVRDGYLHIQTYTAANITYTGSICTKDIFEQSYGYWECKVRFKDKPGTLSDFWLYSDTVATMTHDIENSGAEIDIFEHRSQDNDGKDLTKQIQHSINFNGYEAEHELEYRIVPMETTDQFDVIGFEWTDKEYIFYVNGKETWRTKTGHTRRPEYIILSTEVQNKQGSGEIPIDGYSCEDTMIIDYVRFYSR